MINYCLNLRIVQMNRRWNKHPAVLCSRNEIFFIIVWRYFRRLRNYPLSSVCQDFLRQIFHLPDYEVSFVVWCRSILFFSGLTQRSSRTRTPIISFHCNRVILARNGAKTGRYDGGVRRGRSLSESFYVDCHITSFSQKYKILSCFSYIFLQVYWYCSCFCI